MFTLKEKFNFKVGQPPDELMFPEQFEHSVKHAISKMNDKDERLYTYRFLNYGEVQGDVSVRKELASFLTKDLCYTVYPDNLFITGGVSQSFDLLCTALLKAGDNVLLEGPTYFLFIKVFKDHGVNIHTVQRKEDGTLDMEEVERTIKEKNIKAFYCIPTCHNPIGCHLPLEQRNQLYNIALKYQCYTICDDIYELFFYNGGKGRTTPLFFSSDNIIKQSDVHRKDVLSYDPKENPFIISINSFNKLINPGMRVGWLMADLSVINKVKSIGWLNSGGGMCNTMSHIVRSYMQLGYFEKIINATRQNFGERAKICDDILKGSKAFTYDFPEWGYFFWLKLSDNVNLDKLKANLLKEDMHVLFGESAIHENALKEDKFQFLKRRIRICFVRFDLDQLKAGVKLLREIIENSCDSTKF